MCTKVEDFVKAIEECQGEVEKLTEHAYQDILKITGRLLMGEENIADCLKIETDFESVHKKLEGIRQKSYEYLLTALKDEGSTDL